MDNQVIGDVIADMVIKVAEEREEALDEQIRQLDNHNQDDLEDLRRKRLEAMKGQAAEKKKKMSTGHGDYTMIDEKEFFDVAKKSDRIVIHFWRESTWRCEVMDKHIKQLCQKHWNCRFVKINAEKAQYLCERLHIWCLPSLVLCKGGHTAHTIVGFSEFKTGDECTTAELEELLARWGMVDIDHDASRDD